MNDLDDLMSRLDADPTLPHPGDIDKLISYYRAQRASREAGVKPKRGEASKKQVNLQALGLVKEAPKVQRRI